MKAKEFDEKYPNGLNKVIYQFQKAAYEVLNGEEFHLLIDGLNRKEKKSAEVLYDNFGNTENFSNVHWIPFVAEAPAPLLADIICFMVKNCKEIVRGKDIED